MRQTLCHDGRTDLGFGSGSALPMLGAVQRASLGRGLLVVLSLTLAGLVLISVPLLDGSVGRTDIIAVHSTDPVLHLP